MGRIGLAFSPISRYNLLVSKLANRTIASPPVTWLSPIEWSALERFREEVRILYGDRIHQGWGPVPYSA